MKRQEYIYKAFVVKVYDGDTITCDIDLGFNTWLRNQQFRLGGINAPELRGLEKIQGHEVRNWLADRVLGKEVVIESQKDTKEKYGRWLCYLWLDGVCINTEMLELGLVKKFL